MATISFDIENLIKLTGDPGLVQQLQEAAEAAGRPIDEDFLRPLIRHAVVDAVVKCTDANRKEVSDAQAEARFNAEHSLDATKDFVVVYADVKTRTVAAFTPSMEPPEDEFPYRGPFPEGVSVSVVDRSGYDMHSTKILFKTCLLYTSDAADE